MDRDRFIARIEGTPDALRSLAGMPGVDLYEHWQEQVGPQRYAVQAVLTPQSSEKVAALGCRVTVLKTAEVFQAELAAARRQTENAQPVQLVKLVGPPEILGHLPVNFGVDPPLYSARPLDDSRWEISTQVDGKALEAMRAKGLDVTILADTEALARLRHERP